MKQFILLFLILLSNHVRSNSELLQIIETPFSGFPLYIVDKEQWDQLSSVEKNNLIITISEGGGSGVGNGGHSITCEGKKTVLLDYYEATLSNMEDATYPSKTIAVKNDPRALREHFEEIFKFFPQFYEQYRMTHYSLPSSDQWISAELKNSFDANTAYHFINPECLNPKITQVALQQNQSVFVNEDAFKQLDPFQKQLLEIHEKLYYLSIQNNKSKTSDIIREVIRNVLKTDLKNIHASDKGQELEKIRRSLKKLMGPNFQIRYSPFLFNQDELSFLTAHLYSPFKFQTFKNKEIYCYANRDNFQATIILAIRNSFEMTTQIIHRNPEINKSNIKETSLLNLTAPRVVDNALIPLVPPKGLQAILPKSQIQISIKTITSGQFVLNIESKTNKDFPLKTTVLCE